MQHSNHKQLFFKFPYKSADDTKEIIPIVSQRTFVNTQSQQSLPQNSKCRTCKVPMTGERFKNCAECRKKRKERAANRVRKRYERGICVSCSNPAALPLTICSQCRERKCQLQKLARKFKKAQGICRSCSNPVTVNKLGQKLTVCEMCREKIKQTNAVQQLC